VKTTDPVDLGTENAMKNRLFTNRGCFGGFRDFVEHIVITGTPGMASFFTYP
jgi:hypothetical protein